MIHKLKYMLILMSAFLFAQFNNSELDNLGTLPNSRRLANNIDAKFRNQGSLFIEWKGVYNPNLIYYIYRSDTPILSKSLLTKATVVGNIASVENTDMYSIVDSPPNYGRYYYAIVSYIDNIGFYTGIPNVDAIAVDFTATSVTKQSLSTTDRFATNSYYNDIVNDILNNTNYNTPPPPVVEQREATNTDPNSYPSDLEANTNGYSNYNVTTLYFVAKTNDVNTNTQQPAKKQENTVVRDYAKYSSDYNRALIEFKKGNFYNVVKILEPISRRNINKQLYYNINLLLGKSYKNLKQKKNAITVLKRIQPINNTEVNFWINQVLSDL